MASFDGGSNGSTLVSIIRWISLIHSRDFFRDCWKSYEYIDETPRAATGINHFYLNVRRKTDKGAPLHILCQQLIDRYIEIPKLVLSDFNPVLLTCLRYDVFKCPVYQMMNVYLLQYRCGW